MVFNHHFLQQLSMRSGIMQMHLSLDHWGILSGSFNILHVAHNFIYLSQLTLTFLYILLGKECLVPFNMQQVCWTTDHLVFGGIHREEVGIYLRQSQW
jgi:hypothetical protein